MIRLEPSGAIAQSRLLGARNLYSKGSAISLRPYLGALELIILV